METPKEKKALMQQPLKIVRTATPNGVSNGDYLIMLSNLAIAQSNLIRNTQHDKAWTHYVALCKEIERASGFTYELYEP